MDYLCFLNYKELSYFRVDDFHNFFYEPEESSIFLRPDLSPQCFQLWKEMYCRWDSECLPKQVIGYVAMCSYNGI